jgi:hypothetical protein
VKAARGPLAAISVGSCPSGFRRGDDGELVPHEAEQEAVREMSCASKERRQVIAAAVRARRASGGRLRPERIEPGAIGS